MQLIKDEQGDPLMVWQEVKHMDTIYGKLGGASAVDTTDRDLLAQALEALEVGLTSKEWRELVAALRERLAQPEQEGV